MRSPAELAARALLAVARGMVRACPPRLRKNLEDRFFYAVFQSTRVTNDAYGWKPPPPPPEEP